MNLSYCEDDLIQLSALQHFMFCERQCALIHIEQLWSENLLTAEGQIMHERVDSGKAEKRKNIRYQFSMPLRSLRLGLIGKADAVEFHMEGKKWLPFPVEYKRGKLKTDNADKVQLCAQVLCLEEMLDVDIQKGALFYGSTRRRLEVVIDTALRSETENAAWQVHKMIASGTTPQPDHSAKCKSCSLLQVCMPEACSKKGKARRYLNRVLKDLDAGVPNDLDRQNPA